MKSADTKIAVTAFAAGLCLLLACGNGRETRLPDGADGPIPDVDSGADGDAGDETPIIFDTVRYAILYGGLEEGPDHAMAGAFGILTVECRATR